MTISSARSYLYGLGAAMALISSAVGAGFNPILADPVVSKQASGPTVGLGSGVVVFDMEKIFAKSVYLQKKAAKFGKNREAAQAEAAKSAKAFQEKWAKEYKKLKATESSVKAGHGTEKKAKLDKEFQMDAQKHQKALMEKDEKIKREHYEILVSIRKMVQSIIVHLVEKSQSSSRPIYLVLNIDDRVLWYYDPQKIPNITDDIIDILDQNTQEESSSDEAKADDKSDSQTPQSTKTETSKSKAKGG